MEQKKTFLQVYSSTLHILPSIVCRSSFTEAPSLSVNNIEFIPALDSNAQEKKPYSVALVCILLIPAATKDVEGEPVDQPCLGLIRLRTNTLRNADNHAIGPRIQGTVQSLATNHDSRAARSRNDFFLWDFPREVNRKKVDHPQIPDINFKQSELNPHPRLSCPLQRLSIDQD
jgi:hypothetical protein